MRKIKEKMPTLSEMLGLDKFDLTFSERCDCISLYNNRGRSASLEQAKIFSEKKEKA